MKHASRAMALVVAAALSVVALAATVALERATDAVFYPLALVAVAMSIWLAGGAPALLATALTSAGTALLLLEPTGSLRIEGSDDRLRWALFTLAALTVTAAGQLMRSARARAEASEERLALVSRVHEALEPSLELDDRVRRLATVAVPAMADACWVAVGRGDGTTACARARAVEAGGVEVLAGEGPRSESEGPEVMLASGRAAAAIARAALGDWARDVPDHPRGVIALPLNGRRGHLGIMVLAAVPPRPPFEDAALELAREVARRAALLLDNALLYEAERASSEALARSDALKTTMLRGVAHELRTPLTAITAAAEAIEHATPAERGELADVVVDEARRLERVVGNLLDLSRLDGGVLRPRMDVCSVAELVEGARAATRRLFAPGELTVELDDGCPLVHADPVLSERILVNLLENAARHGAAPVRVEAREAEGGVAIAVSDGGRGVPEGMREALFQPYSRGAGGGLGLGLSLSRRLAEAQRARLELSPDGAAPGACFVLTLAPADVPGEA